MDFAKLRSSTTIGTVLQIAMVVAGHFIRAVALYGFAAGGMAISLVAGVLYGRGASGYGSAALGGAVAGGLCAAIGIAVSVLLGDTAPAILLFGTLGSTVAGAVGGALGKILG
jgi:hypothetical protein